MPYITASIIMQVLGVVIPKLEQLQQEGAVGQRKITQYTRYLGIGIATLQAAGLTFIFGQGRGSAFFGAAHNAPDVKLLPDFMPRALLVIVTLVAGTALIMWMGELISQRGIGNGMSMIIFASVVSTPARQLPPHLGGGEQDPVRPADRARRRHRLRRRPCRARRNAGYPVSFAKRQVGRRMYGGQNTYIPLKVNQSGVVPIIFASSVLLLPVLLTNVLGSGEGWRGWITDKVNRYIVNSQNIVYACLLALLIVAFAYFYNSIAFDPVRQADQIRKQGGFIPGIRPGPQTERYLGQGRQPHHPPRRAVRCSHRAAAVLLALDLQRPELPVRRNDGADCGGRCARADASDR